MPHIALVSPSIAAPRRAAISGYLLRGAGESPTAEQIAPASHARVAVGMSGDVSIVSASHHTISRASKS